MVKRRRLQPWLPPTVVVDPPVQKFGNNNNGLKKLYRATVCLENLSPMQIDKLTTSKNLRKKRKSVPRSKFFDVQTDESSTEDEIEFRNVSGHHNLNTSLAILTDSETEEEDLKAENNTEIDSNKVQPKTDHMMSPNFEENTYTEDVENTNSNSLSIGMDVGQQQILVPIPTVPVMSVPVLIDTKSKSSMNTKLTPFIKRKRGRPPKKCRLPFYKQQSTLKPRPETNAMVGDVKILPDLNTQEKDLENNLKIESNQSMAILTDSDTESEEDPKINSTVTSDTNESKVLFMTLNFTKFLYLESQIFELVSEMTRIKLNCSKI